MFQERILNTPIYKLHILFWIIFITYELMVSYTFSGKFSNVADYLSHYLLNIGTFYCNFYLFKISRKSKGFYLSFLSGVIVELGLYIVLKYQMYKVLVAYAVMPQSVLNLNFLFITASVWRSIYFIGMSTMYWLALAVNDHRKQIADLEKFKLNSIRQKEIIEKRLLESENSYLKAQINPHFLFNSLGFIHNKVFKRSKIAGETIVLLTDMMRYSLRETQNDSEVLILSEIEQIKNCIAINKFRFDNQIYINLTFESDNTEAKIIPLLFINMVENVFKYGELRNPLHPAKIEISIKGNLLEIHINNRKMRPTKSVTGFGVGMSNIKKRLELNYKDTYTLEICDKDSFYDLKLLIQLK